MKQKKLLFGVVLALSVFSIGFSGIVMAETFGPKPEQKKHYKYNYKHAIFEREGQLFQYDEDARTITSLGDVKRAKTMPSLNRTNDSVAFTYENQPQMGKSLTIGILNLKDEQTEDIVIPTRYSNAVNGIEWIDAQTIGVEGHVNPVTSEYFIVDLKSRQVVKHYIGSFFTVLPDHSIMYRGQIPLGSEDRVNDSYYIDEQLVYTSDHPEGSLNYPQLDKNLKHIAFLETYALGTKLIEANFDLTTRSVIPVAKIDVPQDTIGQLTFDGIDEFPSFVNGEGKLELDVRSNKLVKSTKLIDIDLQQEAKDKLDGLNNNLKERFQDNTDKSIAHIQNLHWYS